MRKLLYKKHTLKENLLSVALGITIAFPAVLGLLHNHQPSQEGQVQTTLETVKFSPLIGAPQDLETAPYVTPSAETMPAETTTEPLETTAPPCITPTDFEVYSFIPLSADLQVTIQTACAENEIAYDLILAIIKTESEFDAAAIGDSGNAYGLMQVQPRWWDWLADEKGLNDYKTDPAQNAALGTAILSFLLTENAGDLDKALTAYNGATDYPSRVYANYEWILEQGGSYGNNKT